MNTFTRRVAPAFLLTASLLLVGCSQVSEYLAPESPMLQPTHAPEPPPSPDPPTLPDFEQDEGLMAVMSELIIGAPPEADVRRTSAVETDCDGRVAGCYVQQGPDKAIFIDAVLEGAALRETLAHEYLHYVWFRDGLDADPLVTGALREAYTDPEALGAVIPAHVEAYFDDQGNVRATELFSYACTSLRPEQLPAPVADECAKHLRLPALPVNQRVSAAELLKEIANLRQGQGLAPLAVDPHATQASVARADLFTPHHQVPLDNYPDEVIAPLRHGCSPSTYSAVLTRPDDEARLVREIDRSLEGLLTSQRALGVGVAVTAFDYIDARELFGEQTMRVNATLVITTVCHSD